LVAPHGADDENTAEMAEILAHDFGAYAVINRGWRKSNRVDQFADLANCNNIKHLHEDVVREEFLNPILRSVAQIKRNYGGKATILILHGCNDMVRQIAENELLDMVVGYGAGNPPSHSCRLRTKNAFVHYLQQEGFGVCEGAAGGKYAGRAKNNLNQFFVRWMPDRNVESIQLEIVRELRSDKDMVELTVSGLVSALDSLMLLDDSQEVEPPVVSKI
jgi:hypothetical protein